jgi:hypothetical protein
MSIQKSIILRYRAEGHVRFELPEVLCAPENAERLIARLRRIEGVYRLALYRRQRKLSIRYMETVLDFAALARGIHGAVADLEKAGERSGQMLPVRKQRWRDRLKNARPVQWLGDKYQEARETATAMGIVARRSVRNPPAFLKKENLVIDFLNDVLVLYLIKVHWPLITQQWLRRPIRYRYELLAALYLIFLLVRARRPKVSPQ